MKLKKNTHNSLRGLSLIDTVVGISIITTVFLGLFTAFKLSIDLVYSTKAKIGATALVTERIEHIRSLPYIDMGTVGGIPSGTVPQLEQVDLNGTRYTLRTLILYTDAPEDGLDDLDENSITADYKTIKVEALWSVRDSSRSLFAVSYATPVGLETLTGGGTLRVNVFDALAQPVEGATVHVVNSVVSPAIDVLAETNENGIMSFPGAPEAVGYEIMVTKDGYSTAQTYSVTTENPNPSPTHISVAENDTTTVSFAIDQLGALSFTTFEPEGPGTFSDSFSDQSKLSATTSTTVSAGAVVLTDDGAGVFELSGSADSIPVSPDALVSWDEFSFSGTPIAGGEVLAQLYYDDGVSYTLVPNSELAGNINGLSPGVYALDGLDVQVFHTLKARALLSGDGTGTPELSDWSLSYVAGPTRLPSVDLDIVGAKTVGTTAGGAPLYKTSESFTTDQNGEWTQSDLEWDAYTLFPPSTYDVVEVCPRSISVLPATTTPVSVTLGDATAHSLRVIAEGDGSPMQNAQVSIVLGAFNGSETTSTCGQVYFGSLVSGTYSVTVTNAGFVTHVEDVAVTGDTVLLVSLGAQ